MAKTPKQKASEKGFGEGVSGKKSGREYTKNVVGRTVDVLTDRRGEGKVRDEGFKAGRAARDKDKK